jgi:hypothetical protein
MTSEFSGLPMPVFVAFGWAGEENALKYALSQLELFIQMLHARLPPAIRSDLSFYGLSLEGQNVYLAANEDAERDAYIAFNARPMSLEVQFGVTDREVLIKGLKQVAKDPVVAHHTITQLDPSWMLRIQQMQVDEDSGERTHYQDLYKDSVGNLTSEQAAEIFNKAAYLNSESGWVTPIYLSSRVASERIAAMGPTVLELTGELIATLMPTLRLLTGRRTRKTRPAKSTKSTSSTGAVRVIGEAPLVPAADDALAEALELGVQPRVDENVEEFTYTAELKPLHIRRGFINLTPAHWPFFAVSTRTETRGVTVVFGGRQDKSSSVWRLQPDDQARLMLGPQVHDWLEEHFEANDKIRVTARKIDEDEIRVSLDPVK